MASRDCPGPTLTLPALDRRLPLQIANLGAGKAANPFMKTVVLGVLAGCYVALGAALLLTVGPNCTGMASTNPGMAKYITGAIGFPYALLIILVRLGKLGGCGKAGWR